MKRITMKRLALPVLALNLVCCAGGGRRSPPLLVSVSLSLASAYVFVGGAAQFTATVSGADDASVIWEVNNVAGGDATLGRISSSGLYVAPSSSPNPAAVTITAVSKADTTKSASASVTVMVFSDAALSGQYAFSVSSSAISTNILFMTG